MAKVDFSEILGLQVGSAPKPQPLPEGTYFAEIVGEPVLRTVQTKEGAKPTLAFKFAITEPGPDVDTEELEAAGGITSASGEPKIVTREFWLTDDSRYRLDEFVQTYGITEGTLKEAFEQMVGRQTTLFIALETYERKGGGEGRSNRVQRSFARED